MTSLQLSLTHKHTAHAEIIYHIKILFSPLSWDASHFHTANQKQMRKMTIRQLEVAVVFTLSHHRYETFNHYRSYVCVCVCLWIKVGACFIIWKKGIRRIVEIFVYTGPSHIIFSLIFPRPSDRQEKLAEIYFTIQLSLSPHIVNNILLIIISIQNKFFAWIFFLFRSHFTGFSLNDIFVLLQSIHPFSGYYGSSPSYSLYLSRLN